MMKSLRFTLLSMLMMLCGTMTAQTVFDFDTDGMTLLGLPGESSNDSQDGDITEPRTATVGAFDVTVSAAVEGQKTPNRLWNRTPKLRLYSGTLTIASATEDIKAVEFTLATAASSAKWGADNSASVGTLDASAKTVVKWTGEAREVVISISANTQISKITINGEGSDEPVDPQPGNDNLTGNGTLASPYTPADANTVASQLANGAVSEQDYYIKGKVSTIKYTFSAQYGTATFFISEDGTTEGAQFQCYSVYYLENKAWVDGYTQIAVGDEVIICGKLTNYQGNTPETASKKAYIYSLNGVTKAEGDTPEPTVKEVSVEQALDIINDDLEDSQTTTDTYRVTGFVVGAPDFQRNANGNLYGNVNFDMADEKGGSPVLTVFRAKSFGNEAFTEETISLLKEGDEVVVEGKLQRYVKNDVMTPELSSCYIYSINGKTSGIAQAKMNAQTSGAIYNLQGQRVTTMQRGLYIIDGKKNLVK